MFVTAKKLLLYSSICSSIESIGAREFFFPTMYLCQCQFVVIADFFALFCVCFIFGFFSQSILCVLRTSKHTFDIYFKLCVTLATTICVIAYILHVHSLLRFILVFDGLFVHACSSISLSLSLSSILKWSICQ